MSKSLFNPIRKVGASERDRKCCKGYQYQCCKNIITPTQAPILMNPARDCILSTQLPPPASNIPAARMAPDFARMGWCLSVTTLASNSRMRFTDGDRASEVCCNNRAIDIKAPWRTKSTWSSSIGVKRSMASLFADPAQEMPIARQAPYLTCGLNDSASSDTSLGTTSGLRNMRKPMQVTAARLTSSFTSLTATCNSLRTEPLSAVPQ
mmetsp:Transcript_20535/g.28301  ORF Transcript_20535/g.28301 Transcript_20535/m.28301 type:complete len:208 (+) Transcript_20535:722-1345(+)